MSQQTDRARRLRQTATTGEQAAWQVLRKLRDEGFPVRRQHPIENMIVDFAIERAMLVIEVDGSIHKRDDVQLRDEERDSKLRALGWDILRIPNDLAFHPDHLITLVRERLGIE